MELPAQDYMIRALQRSVLPPSKVGKIRGSFWGAPAICSNCSGGLRFKSLPNHQKPGVSLASVPGAMLHRSNPALSPAAYPFP